MTARDLRPDLRARLDDIQAERVKIQARTRDLDQDEAAIKRMLAIEERRLGNGNSGVPLAKAINEVVSTANSLFDAFATSTLRRAILDEMADRQVHTGESLTEALKRKGVVVPGQLGRSVQGTLLSLQQQRAVKSLGNGKWQLAAQ